jgi:hypothetical protein
MAEKVYKADDILGVIGKFPIFKADALQKTKYTLGFITKLHTINGYYFLFLRKIKSQNLAKIRKFWI